MSDIQHWLDLAPAYVLGALSPEEHRAFESAMAAAPALRQEVARYREVQALLGESHRVRPPSDLRDRVMARVRKEGGPAKATLAPISRAARALPWLGLAASVALAVGQATEIGRLRDTLEATGSSLRSTATQLADRERVLNGILEPTVDLVLLSATGDQAPGIQVFRNRATNTAVLHAFRLRPAPDGRAYQLWLIRDGGGAPEPSRVFNSEADGHALVEGITIPGEGVDAYAVTEEPAAGSSQPTMPILLFGRVPTG